MPRLVATLIATLLTTALGLVTVAAPAEAALPTKKHWVSDVHDVMIGSRIYVGQRVAQNTTGRKLAINFDIDNTTLATHYQLGAPVPYVKRFATYATGKHVTLLFNTGRLQTRTGAAVRQLRAAGYTVGGICGRSSASESLAHSKQRCRQKFIDRGYTLIANVGNRSTDFTGTGYRRAYRLPSYGNQLG